VHGKNHHLDGSFARHVLEMRIVTPSGPATISPDLDGELFWATIGGMGLTGIVSSVTLKLLKIETDQVLVDTQRFSNLDEVMSEMTSGDENFRYSVAWVDCMTRGAKPWGARYSLEVTTPSERRQSGFVTRTEPSEAHRTLRRSERSAQSVHRAGLQ